MNASLSNCISDLVVRVHSLLEHEQERQRWCNQVREWDAKYAKKQVIGKRYEGLDVARFLEKESSSQPLVVLAALHDHEPSRQGDESPEDTFGRWADGKVLIDPWDGDMMSGFAFAHIRTLIEHNPATGEQHLTEECLNELSNWLTEQERQLKEDATTGSKLATDTASGHAIPPALVEVLLDKTHLEIAAVAQNKDLTVDQRMRAIAALDRLYHGKNSREWAELLNVTPQAIRHCNWWKRDRRTDY